MANDGTVSDSVPKLAAEESLDLSQKGKLGAESDHPESDCLLSAPIPTPVRSRKLQAEPGGGSGKVARQNQKTKADKVQTSKTKAEAKDRAAPSQNSMPAPSRGVAKEKDEVEKKLHSASSLLNVSFWGL